MHNIFIEDKGEIMNKQKIILCGGGTLGHFTPNIAIFEALKDKLGQKAGLKKALHLNLWNTKK